jgi:hypothetical protein
MIDLREASVRTTYGITLGVAASQAVRYANRDGLIAAANAAFDSAVDMVATLRLPDDLLEYEILPGTGSTLLEERRILITAPERGYTYQVVGGGGASETTTLRHFPEDSSNTNEQYCFVSRSPDMGLEITGVYFEGPRNIEDPLRRNLNATSTPISINISSSEPGGFGTNDCTLSDVKVTGFFEYAVLVNRGAGTISLLDNCDIVTNSVIVGYFDNQGETSSSGRYVVVRGGYYESGSLPEENLQDGEAHGIMLYLAPNTALDVDSDDETEGGTWAVFAENSRDAIKCYSNSDGVVENYNNNVPDYFRIKHTRFVNCPALAIMTSDACAEPAYIEDVETDGNIVARCESTIIRRVTFTEAAGISVLGVSEHRADTVSVLLDDCDITWEGDGGEIITPYENGTVEVRNTRITTTDDANDANVCTMVAYSSISFTQGTILTNENTGAATGYCVRISNDEAGQQTVAFDDDVEVTGNWLAAVSLATASEDVRVDLGGADFSGITNARVVAFSDSYLGEIIGTGPVFNDGAGVNFRPFHVIGGADPGSHSIVPRTDTDPTPRTAAASLSLPISYGTFTVGGATTIETIDWGLSANNDMARYFDGARIFLVLTDGCAFADSDNIAPLNTNARAAATVVLLVYDHALEKWVEHVNTGVRDAGYTLPRGGFFKQVSGRFLSR